MAEHIKGIIAVAFLVASVPVLLLPGKFTITLTTGQGTLTSQEGDELAKQLLDLSQQVSALRKEHATEGAEGASRRLRLDNETRGQEHDADPSLETQRAPLRRLSGDPGWTLLLSTNLASTSIGDFASGTQVGSLANSATADYRIGKSGAQLQSEGLTGIRVTTASGHHFQYEGTLYPSGFDNTCTSCNCPGNTIGGGFWWHGGKGGCYGSTHFGLKREADVHSVCNDGNADDSSWGHFHRSGVDTGVYFFGDVCINENEWQERFFFWGRQPSQASGATAGATQSTLTLKRRAVYTRWGSKSCPLGSVLLYSGFMSTSHYTHSGSGYNMLCMHPSPQLPSGYDAANNEGALLYGVEYENTGAIDRHHDHDAACAVCQWQNGATVFVEWGNAESRHNPSTPKTCSNPAHEMIYTGLIMSEHYTHRKSEHICVDLDREYVGEADQSDDNYNGGLLYTTEMEHGAADEYAYPHDREVGCTVCGIPAKSVNADGEVTIMPESETAVFTVWGKRQCPGEGVSSEQLYTGFVAGSYYDHGGSGANQICMTTSNPNAPSGYSDGNQNGALLYGAEYQNTGAIDANHNGDAACVVCRYLTPHKDVYVQWGRSSSCSNSHAAVYNGYSMGEKFTHHRSTRVCVHTARETHARSDWSDHNGALLYTTELEMSVSGVAANAEVGCSSCAGAGGKSVYTRWGSRSCPVGSSLLYEGNMMAEHYTHRGGGANTICMHPQMQNPAGWSSGNENGDLLYKMEYQNTGAIDANHDHEAACAVCELAHWESVYTQWGRSTTCASGHLTLYTGFIMSERYNHNKGEFLCVDSERAVTANSNGGDQNGGLLYTSEMEHGSSQGDQYPHNVEVGCSVCAAEMQELEVPFVRQTEVAANGESYFKNAIHGEWVKVASLTAGQSATVSYGYTASGGTSSSERETQESAQARANDMSSCTSTSFTASTKSSAWASASAGFFVTSTTKVQVDVGFSSTTGLETCGGETNTQATSIARAMTQATKWDQSVTESRSFSLSIPSQIPAGVPEAETMSTLGVDVWQWEWTIGEGAHDDVSAKMYKSKSESRFVFVPVPTGTTERRPCCKPTQEYGVLWYPFNCKTAEGLLPGAESAAHCKVGAPGGSPAQQWSAQEVVEWLDTLGLGASQAPPPAAWTQDGTCILGPGSQRLLVQDDTSEGTSYPDDMRAADCWSACVARGSYGCCRINYDWTPARCHWDPTGMTSTPTTGSAHWASNIQAEPGDNPIGCEVYASNASWCDEPGRDLEGAAADKCCACGGGEPPHDLGAAGAGGALLEDASCLPADGAEAPWLSLDALAVPPPGPGAEPAVAVVSAVVQGADALGLLPAPARAVLSRMILTLPLPKAPTATPATPMEDVVLRIANAGFTGWRPNVAEVKFYSDQLCTKRVTRERLHNSSGWNHAPGQKKYTPDLAIDGSEAAQSHWRPQCSSCQPDEAWIEFAFKPSTVIQCIEANNLGKGSGGGKHWDGGIRVYNVTDQIYRDGARQVVVGYAEGNTFILEEERGPTTATLTTSVVEAPAVDIFSEDLKAFSFLYASEYTERSPKRDGATPNRPHLGPRADSVGTVQVDVEGRQLRLQGAGQASQGVPSVTSEVIVKVSDGKVQFWARTSLPAPDTWERCWHAETDLPSSFVDDRPVNPFSRSVPVLGMKPAKEPGDRFELNLSPTEQVRFSVENRSRLRSILLEDRGGGSGGGGGHDVVVTVTKWATAPLGKGTFDPASLGCADLHVPGREVNRWLERWALLRVFLPGPPSGGKDPDPARLLQGASGAKELPELYAV